MKQELIKRKTKIKDYAMKPLSRMSTKVSALYSRNIWSLSCDSILPFNKRNEKFVISVDIVIPLAQENRSNYKYSELNSEKFIKLSSKKYYNIQHIDKYKISSNDIKVII